MSNPFNGPVSRLWIRWKSLNLPWRKQRLAGFDLHGNTFWEFKDTVRSDRWRRIARQPRTVDYADIQISPQWHQWLRHTRPEPPSVAEQQADVQRQLQIKELAQLADARWSNQQSYLKSPQAASVGNAGAGGQRGADAETLEDGRRQDRGLDQGPRTGTRTARRDDDPWEQQRQVRDDWQGSSEKWQPKAWDPAGKKSGAG